MIKSRRFGSVLLSFVLAAGVLAGCSDSKNETAGNVELTISAAASLSDVMKEIQTNFESKNKSIKLNFNLGASGALQQQIEQGAPSDLFFSAATKNMTALVDKKLIEAAQQKNIVINELVVVIPADGKVTVQKIEDLADAKIKNVAIGEPATVPAGSYAKEALTNVKLWDPLQPKIVQGKDVRQVLTYVESGNAEAGFVYKTDALSSNKVKVAFAVDPKTYAPVEYPAGIVKATKHMKEAELFLAYLQTKEAKDLFVKYGFSLPK